MTGSTWISRFHSDICVVGVERHDDYCKEATSLIPIKNIFYNTTQSLVIKTTWDASLNIEMYCLPYPILERAQYPLLPVW